MSNMRDLVKDGYNNGKYDQVYARTDIELEPFEKMMVDQLLSHLSEQSSILDLGCGVGLPYDGYVVSKGHRITGVDISSRHIEQAKKNVSKATYYVGDFFSEDVQGKYDAIMSYYAIFHIPREEHAKLLQHIYSLLADNGVILITLGAYEMECDISDDFVGAPMAWSSYSVEQNKQVVRDTGFEILIAAEDHRQENHLWILAKKK